MAVKIEVIQGLPEAARGAGQPGPYLEAMRQLKAPVGNKFSTFFAPAEVDAAITDEAEREKATLDQCRRMMNRFAGMAKRMTKEDPTFKAALRREHQDRDDAATPLGIRVYRIKAG